ncbi:sensor histidine kinase [Bacteriovoracaceae bacterium]|nr:sensor histidine kinase [Bacteriovoracaceae bacterium]
MKVVISLFWVQGALSNPMLDIDLDEHIELFVDRTNSKTINQMFDQTFISYTSDEGNRMRRNVSDNIWVKFQIQDEWNIDDFSEYYISSYMGTFAMLKMFYVTNEGKIIESKDYGFKVPLEKRPHSFMRPFISFPKNVDIKQVYMKIRNAKTRRVGFSFVLLGEKRIYEAQNTQGAIIIGILAILLALGMYNFFIFMILKDYSYLLYIFFNGGWFLSILTVAGLADLIFNIKGFYFTEYGTTSVVLTGCLGVVFTRSFLKIREFSVNVDRFMIGVASVCFLVSILNLPFFVTHFSLIIVNIVNLVANFTMIISAIWVYKKGYRAAKYFIFANAGMMLFVMIWMCKEEGFLRGDFFTIHAALFGCACEMLLMSIALAHRFKIYGDERIQMQKFETESMELKRLFRIVCHDLINPLSVIRSMNRKGLQEDPKNKYLSKSTKATEILTDILKSVRKMESFRTSQKKIELESVDLEKVFRNIKMLFSERLEDKHLALEFTNIQPDCRYVWAERVTITSEVISNLVSNAIKFSYPGGIIRIALSVIKTDEGDFVKLECEDNGMGMPVDIVEKLFTPTPITSRKGTSKEAGTGYGMSIVSMFMEAYDGKVEVQSICQATGSINHGTRVSLTFKRGSNI